MMIALENNIDLSPKDLVPTLRKQMTADIKELFGASSDDVLEELVGLALPSRMGDSDTSKVTAALNKLTDNKLITNSIPMLLPPGPSPDLLGLHGNYTEGEVRGSNITISIGELATFKKVIITDVSSVTSIS